MNRKKGPGSLSRQKAELFQRLPQSLTIVEFFQIAEDEGLSYDQAREHLAVYLKLPAHRPHLYASAKMYLQTSSRDQNRSI